MAVERDIRSSVLVPVYFGADGWRDSRRASESCGIMELRWGSRSWGSSWNGSSCRISVATPGYGIGAY